MDEPMQPGEFELGLENVEAEEVDGVKVIKVATLTEVSIVEPSDKISEREVS